MRSGDRYAQRPELLKSHPVLARLVTLKQSLSTLEDLDFAASDEESDIDDDESLSLNMDGDEDEFDREQLWKSDRLNGLEADELDELLMDAQFSLATSKMAGKPPKKKRKVDSANSKKPALLAFDLVEPEYSRSKSSSLLTSAETGDIDAYGEATSLQHADQADKNARKKSLRFHTSKIESASARRQGARNNAISGDDDIPYRERRKEKEARIVKELEKKAKSRGQGQGGDDLDDVEPEKEPRKRQRDEEEDDGQESADGYYELVKRKTKEKKDKKKSDYEEAQAAARYVLSPYCTILTNSSVPVRTSRTTQLPARGHLPAQSCLTKASHLTGRKASVTPESRKDKSSKRRKRRSLLRRLSTRAALGIQGDMTVKSQVYRRWLRVFVWVKIWLVGCALAAKGFLSADHKIYHLILVLSMPTKVHHKPHT